MDLIQTLPLLNQRESLSKHSHTWTVCVCAVDAVCAVLCALNTVCGLDTASSPAESTRRHFKTLTHLDCVCVCAVDVVCALCFEYSVWT